MKVSYSPNLIFNRSFKPKESRIFKDNYKHILSFSGKNLHDISKTLKAGNLQLSFSGKVIDGVWYSNKVLMLGGKKLLPQQAKELYTSAEDKVEQIETYKKNIPGYTNSRNGVEGASVIGSESGKLYSAAGVDFYSGRWGCPAGIIASMMAINDLNDSVSAIACTSLSHDRRSLNWLLNTDNYTGKSRGGINLQVLSKGSIGRGKNQFIKVQTLEELICNPANKFPVEKSEKEFDPAKLGISRENLVNVNGKFRFKPQDIKINKIIYSEKAKIAANKLQLEKGFNVDRMLRDLIESAQQHADRVSNKIVDTKGEFDPTPVTHFPFFSAVLGDNNKIYTANNVEFYNDGFLYKSVCGERMATARAVNDGSNKIKALALTSNQEVNDMQCGECIAWLNPGRGGSDVLYVTYERDHNQKKTDKLKVLTLGELLPFAYKPSPKAY